MNITFIYALVDPRTLKIRYVGKADNPYQRYCRHLIDKYPCHRVDWIRSLLKIGLLPIQQILEECDKSEWEQKERYWIAFERKQGYDLTNGTDGGDGYRGGKHTEESKRKASDHSPMKGKHLSEQEKEIIRQRQLGKPHPHKGQFFSDKSKRKMSRPARTKPPVSKETMKKLKDVWKRPGYREHMVTVHLRKNNA